MPQLSGEGRSKAPSLGTIIDTADPPYTVNSNGDPFILGITVKPLDIPSGKLLIEYATRHIIVHFIAILYPYQHFPSYPLTSEIMRLKNTYFGTKYKGLTMTCQWENIRRKDGQLLDTFPLHSFYSSVLLFKSSIPNHQPISVQKGRAIAKALPSQLSFYPAITFLLNPARPIKPKPKRSSVAGSGVVVISLST